LLKTGIYSIPVLASLLTVLQLLGYLEIIKRFLDI